MPIPDYQSAMLPMLLLVAEKGRIRIGDAVSTLASRLNLTEEERGRTFPDSSRSVWRNRATWAATYLVHAGLLERPSRGLLDVTTEGKRVASDPPPQITVKWLKQYPAFLDFYGRSSDVSESVGTVSVPEVVSTPEERLENANQELRKLLKAELLQRCKVGTPRFFEELVVELLVRMGYGGSFADAALAIGRSGDGGIDGIIKEDRLGFDYVMIQAKRWEGSVGSGIVQEFAGSLLGHGASKGVIITTSSFTASAKEYAERLKANRIVLIDGERLADLMIDHNVGVNEVVTYSVKRVDEDFFEEVNP